MIHCPWCHTSYSSHQTNCDNCGGPLRPPPGADPGLPPPDPPRHVPAKFVRRLRLTHNVMVMIGLAFLGIGMFVGLTFTAAGMGRDPGPLPTMGLGILGLFGGVGATLAWIGNRKAMAVLRALRHGVATRGEITAVYRDTSIRINGRSPWGIDYQFQVGNQNCTGKAHSWDDTARERQPGQPLHVLYVEGDPDQSTIWPPVD